jgi:small conductance mechanosensitive channel
MTNRIAGLTSAIFLAVVHVTATPTVAIAQSGGQSPPPVNDITSLLAKVEDSRADMETLKKLIGEAEGEVRQVLERRLEEQQISIVNEINTLGRGIAERESGDDEATRMRDTMVDLLQQLMPGLRKQIERQKAETVQLMTADPPESPRVMLAREIAIEKSVAKLISWYAAFLRSIETLEAYELAAEKERDYLIGRLTELAETLSAALDLAIESVNDTAFILALTPDDAETVTHLKVVELKRDTLLKNLGTVVELLDDLNLDSTEYGTLILKVSGDLSSGILDQGVLKNLLGSWGKIVWTWTSENSLQWILKLIVLVVILLIARTLSRLTRRLVERGVGKARLSILLRKMIVSVAANAVLLIGILIALSQLGISVGPLLAGLGVAGIVIGFALQDTLANFAAGMMILLYRPYDVGDVIEAGGTFGTVDDMSLVSTIILTFDNQKLVVPNNMIWGNVIRNVTAQTMRRVDLTFGISYESDVTHAERVLGEIIAEHDRILKDPEPVIKVHTLGESSVDFVVRPWVKTDDYWDVYWHLTREVKLRFDAEGISIPYPQRDVHVFTNEKAPAVASPSKSSAQEKTSKTAHGSDAEQLEAN